MTEEIALEYLETKEMLDKEERNEITKEDLKIIKFKIGQYFASLKLSKVLEENNLPKGVDKEYFEDVKKRLNHNIKVLSDIYKRNLKPK